MKMEQTECSKTSAYKIQMLGNYPEENIQQYADMLTHMTMIQLSYDHHLHPNGTICIHVINTNVLIVKALQMCRVIDSSRISLSV